MTLKFTQYVYQWSVLELFIETALESPDPRYIGSEEQHKEATF